MFNFYHAKGTHGERQTCLLLAAELDHTDYQRFDDITLHTADTTTIPIDGTIMSRFEVFGQDLCQSVLLVRCRLMTQRC